jgi:hypothetical protein
MAAECLQPGFVVQLADDRKARIHAAGLIRRTQYENIGFAADDRVGIGMVFDLENGIRLANEMRAMDSDRLELGEPYLTPVYNFTVDEFHTYYVGEAGVWVHNANCAVETAFTKASNEALIKDPQCFMGETLVLTPAGACEICVLPVGSLVLSRCEKTGRQGYRRVTKKFEHECEEQRVIRTVSEYGAKNTVFTTDEHPFWVDGIGWVPAGELKVGQKLLLIDPFFDNDKSQTQLIESGKLYTTEITEIGRRNTVEHFGKVTFKSLVYNIEVEEFHTYFVEWSGIWVHNTKYAGPAKPLQKVPEAARIEVKGTMEAVTEKMNAR